MMKSLSLITIMFSRYQSLLHQSHSSIDKNFKSNRANYAIKLKDKQGFYKNYANKKLTIISTFVSYSIALFCVANQLKRQLISMSVVKNPIESVQV